MAVPKYRPSSHRQGRRRSKHKVKLPEVEKCPHCGADKQPHFVCENCGKPSKKQKLTNKKENGKETKKETGSKT